MIPWHLCMSDKQYRQHEKTEQYGKRTCLRIVGIPKSENKTGEECLQKVIKEINETKF